MALDSTDNLFVVQLGVNKVGRLDPKTLEIRQYTLPLVRDESRSRRTTWSGIPTTCVATWSPGSRDRQGHRVAVTERAAVSTL